jgi:hypothetical protein
LGYSNLELKTFVVDEHCASQAALKKIVIREPEMIVEPAAVVRPVKRCGRLRPARRKTGVPIRVLAKRFR